ncbi:hypothetical protein OHB07_04605 [Streptomyces sp. NBC_00111]|uniref:hypothetical protein n=1 Tax=unclassified Streptomyces TaxID=2593676 RepID=UPI002E30482A|nr:hypothetical protein [Streptomyces sp. NBC_01460]
MYSAIAACWSAGLDTMDAFHQELRDSDFDLNREAVLRLMSLLVGTGAHHIKLIGAEVDETALKETSHATERALRFAIDFLKGECSIPRSEILSSPNGTTVPALLLHHRWLTDKLLERRRSDSSGSSPIRATSSSGSCQMAGRSTRRRTAGRLDHRGEVDRR